MTVLTATKVNALPGSLDPNKIYMIPDADSAFAKVYISSSDGLLVRRTPTKQDIIDLIASYGGGGGGGGPTYTAGAGLNLSVGNVFSLATPVNVSYLGTGTPSAATFLRGDGSWQSLGTGTPSSSNFLRGDGAWASVGTGTPNGLKYLKDDGSWQPLGTGTPTTGKFLRGDGAWASVGTGTPDGTKFLRDDGSWAAVPAPSVTTLNATGAWSASVAAASVRIGATANGGVVSFSSPAAAADNRLSYFESDANGTIHFKLATDTNSASVSVMSFDRDANILAVFSLASTEINLIGHTKLRSVSYDSNSLAGSTVDCSLGNFFKKTVTTDLTWTATNVPASRFYSFILEITNGGAGVMTWFTGIKWTGGTAPTLSVVGTDILGFYTEDSGASWRGLILSLDNKAPA